MLLSDFCVHIGGDTPTRKSFVDAILAACIPVILRNDSVFVQSLPYSHVIPYLSFCVHVPETSLLAGQAHVVRDLVAISQAEIRRRRALMLRWAPLLYYPDQSDLQASSRDDGPSPEPNAVTTALGQLVSRRTPS